LRVNVTNLDFPTFTQQIKPTKKFLMKKPYKTRCHKDPTRYGYIVEVYYQPSLFCTGGMKRFYGDCTVWCREGGTSCWYDEIKMIMAIVERHKQNGQEEIFYK